MLRTFVACLLLLLLVSRAEAQKRVALVIGNGAYTKVPKLNNPKNDAAAMEAMLKAARFDAVVRANDLGVAAMRRALRDFSDKTHDADIAIVFYAGHGMEVGGINYLIPTDAVLERDIDAQDEAISLDRVSQILEPATRLRLVILDACRDNPFVRTMRRTMATRAIRSGYGEIDERSLLPNTLVAYAQRVGATAEDGSGANSPYTTALLKHLPTPGLDIDLALRRVRDDVLKLTRNRQEPFRYGSLGGAEIPLVVAPAALSAPTVPTYSAAADAARVCREVEGMSSLSMLGVLANQHKGTPAGDCVVARLEELKKQQLALVTPLPQPMPVPAPEPSSTATSPDRLALDTLFAAKDRQEVEGLARKHGLILPPFNFAKSNRELPDKYRKFIGVWVDEVGQKGKGRRNMMILTTADAAGRLRGFQLYGPPDETSFDQAPAGSNVIDTPIEGSIFHYTANAGRARFEVRLFGNNSMQYTYANTNGQTTMRSFRPVWRLMDAERKAER